MNLGRAGGVGPLILGAALLFPAALRAQPADVVARAEVSPLAVKLSQSVRLTLALEGPAPLRVELPKQLLTDDADGIWRIQPSGEAEVKPLPNGRQRWQQVYRLAPYPSGTLRVTFNPVTVNGQPVTWREVVVTVTRTGAADAPLPEPHAVTAVEDLPDTKFPPPRTSRVWAVVAGAFAFALVALVVPLVMWRRARRAKPVPPDEWARAALAELATSRAPGGVIAERVAAILRRFVERRFAIPATKLTTAELSAATVQQGWAVEEAEALRVLLDQCDRAKFAGDAPDNDGCRRLIAAAVDWVNDVSRPRGPR